MAQLLATIKHQPRMSRSGRFGDDATFEAVRSSIGDAGVVALLVAAYCHVQAHVLQVELPEGAADALTY